MLHSSMAKTAGVYSEYDLLQAKVSMLTEEITQSLHRSAIVHARTAA
jgi:hypothetical protein